MCLERDIGAYAYSHSIVHVRNISLWEFPEIQGGETQLRVQVGKNVTSYETWSVFSGVKALKQILICGFKVKYRGVNK